MTDKTNQRLRVRGDERTGAYLMVPLEQLEEVRRLLDGHGINYWVDEHAISLGGQPAVAFVNFGLDTEGKKVQAILDQVA